jgi:flavin reductase (DIM6/NTAB) family NADH-FMN oxidoreductase RutF
MKTIEMKEAAPGFAYDLLASFIVPRPIAFVSTLSPSGVGNLAPFSYFMPGGVVPPSLAFCPILGSGGAPKDSLRNIEATGEFVVNLVTRPMAEGMNQAAAAFAYEESEWPWSGLTSVPSLAVAPARVGESPVQMECRTLQIIRQGDHAGAGVFVIGEVVVIHAEEALLSEAPPASPPLIARLGGSQYLDLDGGKLFDLPRPAKPASSS